MHSQRPLPARARLEGRRSLPALLLLVITLAAVGLEPHPARAERYSLLKFLPAQGLSQSQVTCLLQDSNGYLWLGTFGGGLDRFDGQSFRAYRQPDGLNSARVRNLIEVKGQLYVGTRVGLYRRVNDRFEVLPTVPDRKLDIYGLALGRNGVLSVATDVGLFKLEGSRLKPDDRPGLQAGQPIREIASSPDGNLWAIGRDWLGLLTDAGLQPVPVPTGLELEHIIQDPAGGAFVGTRRGLYHTDGKTLVSLTNLSPALSQSVTSLYVDQDRNLWVGSRKGVLVLKDRKVRTYGPENGFPSVKTWATLQDREGNIFFGTDGDGLLQLPRQPFSTFSTAELQDYAPMASVVDRAGRRWIATLGQGLWYVVGNKATQVGEDSGLTSLDCTSLMLDGQDSLWVGTNTGLFAIKLSGDNLKAAPIREVGNQSIIGLLADGDKRYVSSERGLWVFDGRRWRGFNSTEGADALPTRNLYSMLKTKDGALWVATSDAGLFRWDMATQKLGETLSTAQGLPSSTVQCLWEDTDGSLWIGTDQGLAHKTPQGLKVFTSRDGLPDDTINFITQDPESGILWVGTNRGVAARVDDAWRTYAVRQGLPDDETNTNSCFWDSAGKLWAGTTHGYGVLISSPPPRNSVPPVVQIESVQEGDHQIDPHSNPNFQFKHNTLSFRFLGSSLTDPSRVRYRYRLGGLEDNWTETSQREARYPVLRPGAYLFEVSASNNDGMWAQDPARFSFAILPPFWETWWFRAAQVMAIFFSGFLVYAVRATALRRRAEKLERLITERTHELQMEKERSEKLLLNILPAPIADELKEKGVASTRLYSDVTILFTDFQDFTRMCANLSPERLVDELNEVFAAFDDICRAHRMEKLKTIGDAFMAAGGLPTENGTHPLDAVEAAIQMQEYLEARSELEDKLPFKLRIGLHTGPVVAGVIGKWKFAYDIWGDAVNTAARMESSGAAGEINLSRSTYDRVRQHFVCEARGQVLAKGKGALEMFFVRSRRRPGP